MTDDSTTPSIAPDPSTFAYIGQTSTGREINGSIQAQSPDQAQAELAELGLRVLTLEQTAPARRPRKMGLGEFQAFNQQLAHLAKAGFPLEQGLRLVGQDLGSGRLARSVHAVADELERGASLSEAFAKHRKGFPELYGAVLEAGVKTNNLPGVLMGLGRHLELTRKLAAAAWRASVYPLIVLVCMLGVLTFLGMVIAPEFDAIYGDWDVQLPELTMIMMSVLTVMPWISLVLVGVILAGVVTAAVAKAAGYGQAVASVLLPIPMIGPILKRNLVSRWCDSVRLAVEAGLDLPAALEMASTTMASPAIHRDTNVMLEALSHGRPIDARLRLRLIPPAVPAAIDLTRSGEDLPQMLANLSSLYADQAEARISAFQAVLGPVLLVFIGLVIGVTVVALFLPMVTLMQSVL